MGTILKVKNIDSVMEDKYSETTSLRFYDKEGEFYSIAFPQNKEISKILLQLQDCVEKLQGENKDGN